jgi:hypothetical protein
MKILRKETFYQPTFLDMSRSYRGEPTGVLSATIFTRTFMLIENQKGKRHIDAQRGFLFQSWKKDTLKSKAAAIKLAVRGMKKMKELNDNPPLNFIPNKIEKWLSPTKE